MSKTRNELQKEINRLLKLNESISIRHNNLIEKKLKVDLEIDECKSENNRLQSELEHQEQLVIEKDAEIADLNVMNTKLHNAEGGMLKQIVELRSEIESARTEKALYGVAIRKSTQSTIDNLRKIVIERNKERRTIKNYNLFQLIRWWLDAKN
jgi:chromosome segregation ATPase